MFGCSNGVVGHSTCLEIPHSIEALESSWTLELGSTLDAYARPLAYGGSVFTHDKAGRVVRLGEEGEQATGWKMNSACQLMGAGRFVLVPMHGSKMGEMSVNGDHSQILTKVPYWAPCGALIGDQTTLVFPDQTLLCETGELRPNKWFLIGNIIDGLFYGEARKSRTSKTIVGRGALNLETEEWEWQDDRLCSVLWIGDRSMVVNVFEDDQPIGQVWDRRTRTPVWTGSNGFVTSFVLYRDTFFVGTSGVFDMATGHQTQSFFQHRGPSYLERERFLWCFAERSENGKRAQAIVRVDLEEKQEVYRLELSPVSQRTRSDFMYDDGKFYRLLSRRLECYGPTD